MSVVINTNYTATIAANNLAASNNALQKSLNRLSSGSKIVNPSDDAGGLAVAMKLSAISKRQNAISLNIGNAISFLQTQDGALKVASKVLDRMSELKTYYSDPTKNATDKANYDAEFAALQSELTAVATERFNGSSLFASSDLSIPVSEDANTSSAVTLYGRDLTSTNASVGVGFMTAASISGSLGNVALSEITNAIQNVATMRAKNGAEQSRLQFASEMLTTNKANMETAMSRIMDVDVAEESTQLARWNILVQSGTAMLTQANQSSQTALRLLQG